MKFILGKKLKMTQVWEGDKVISVTPVVAGPCFVTQIKTEANDGYNALQVGFYFRKEKNLSKPVKNHLAKAGQKSLRYLKEFRVSELPEVKLGDQITAETFSKGDAIDVTGTSKGKGFQGVVKRHGFSGSKATHGNKDQSRHSGSVAPKGPAHVFKGTRMGGHMGDARVTIKNLEVVNLDLGQNIIYVKGAVPGATNSLVMIKGQGDLKITTPTTDVKEEVKAEDVVVEDSVATTDSVVAETSEAVVAETPVEQESEEKKVE